MSIFNSNGSSTVTIDDSAGAPQALTAYVKEVDGLEKVYAALESTALADTSEKRTIGIQEALTLTIRGDYNDAANGPHSVLSGIVGKEAFTSTITIVIEGTSQFSFEAICTKYQVSIKNKELVGYEATLVSDGAITVA